MSHTPLHLIERAAHEGAFGQNLTPEPSEAQCRAGNYKVGRVSLYGLNLAIEQPRGSTRSGVDEKTGKAWSSRMAAHYGYIGGTTGADGDGVDCFIGPLPESERAYVINQNIGGQFDEHKVMLAFPDLASARAAYLNSYERGWDGLESIVPASLSQLKWWLDNGDLKSPLRADTLPKEGLDTMKKTHWNTDALPYDTTLDKVLYDIRRSDSGEGLLLDAVTAQEIIDDADGALAFDALVTPYAKLERRMELLRGIMERTGDKVKPIALQVTDPFKQRGVANVAAIFELSDGQTVTIFFHNPDVTPNKMAPADEVISWKWLLNKKDITIVVAPERGADLNIREVARRIMRLAEKNSPAFQRVNVKRAERMQNIQALKDEIAGLEAELAAAQHELEVAKVDAEDAQNKKNRAYADAVQQVSTLQDAYLRATQNGGTDPKTGQTKEALSAQIDSQAVEVQRLRDIANGVMPAWMSVDPTTADGYEKIRLGGEYAKAYWQDRLDALFQSRAVAVRNAMRELGWGGPTYAKSLSKAGVTASWNWEYVGAGKNVVGYFVELDNHTKEAVRDDLSMTTDEFAKYIDGLLPVSSSTTQEDPATGAPAVNPSQAKRDQVLSGQIAIMSDKELNDWIDDGMPGDVVSMPNPVQVGVLDQWQVGLKGNHDIKAARIAAGIEPATDVAISEDLPTTVSSGSDFTPDDYVTRIVEVHGVKDQNKLQAIQASMEKSGWVGRPVLAYKDASGAVFALTASHRIAAAKNVGIEIPVFYVDPGTMEFEDESGNFLSDVVGSGDDRVLDFLKKAGDEQAHALMQEEIITEWEAPPVPVETGEVLPDPALTEEITVAFISSVLPTMANNRDRIDANPDYVMEAFDRWWINNGKSFASRAPLLQIMRASDESRSQAYVRLISAIDAHEVRQNADSEVEFSASFERSRVAAEAAASEAARIAAENAADERVNQDARNRRSELLREYAEGIDLLMRTYGLSGDEALAEAQRLHNNPEEIYKAYAKTADPDRVVASVSPDVAATSAHKPDITYRNSADGLFTSFFPNTPEGEKAWNTINATPGAEGGKMLASHAAPTIAQLRKAGYTVAEDTSVTTTDKEADALAAALEDPPQPDEQALIDVAEPIQGNKTDAYKQGRNAAFMGYSIEFPTNIRSDVDKEDWQTGWTDGNSARVKMLLGMDTIEYGDRKAVPVIARFDGQYKAVWRDERSGKDYETKEDALAGITAAEDAHQAILKEIDKMDQKVGAGETASTPTVQIKEKSEAGAPESQGKAPEVSMEDKQKQADRALFQSVIDGTVADILAPELADSMEAAYYRQQTDPVLVSLFEQAVDAYQGAMMAATTNLGA